MFSAENNGTKRLLFGVSLYELYTTEPQHQEFEIPIFIANMILYLDSHGHVPGIFKNKVDNNEVEDLMRRLENGEKIETDNAHAVAGLLLSFLIYLPEPILLKQYNHFIDAARKNDVIALQQLVFRLPLPHYLILRALLLLLHHLSADQHIADVGTSDLAQVFAPLLLMGPVSSMESDMEEIIRLGEMLIEEYDIILAPIEEGDYATLTTETNSPTQKSQKYNFSQPTISTSSLSLSPSLSSSSSSLAPFQRSKYSVNYLEIKFSSLSPQSSPLSLPSKNLSNTQFHSPSLYPPYSSPLSPSKNISSSYSPQTTKSPPVELRSHSPTPSSVSPSISPLLSRSNNNNTNNNNNNNNNNNKSSVSVSSKQEPAMIGIYGSEPGLKYVESNHKLRQLDARFEEMVENMQEKRSLFLNQIDSIRKRMVLSTPELRWTPFSPSSPSSPSISRSQPPRTPPPSSLSPSRTPPPLPRTPPPSALPLSSSSSLVNPSLSSQTPHSPSSRASHTSRSQSPIPLDPPPSLNSPNLRRMSPSPLLYAERVSVSDDQSDKDSDDGDIEQMLRKTRSTSSLSGEERDIESLHNYYYGKMKALYTEMHTLKDNIKNLQKEAAGFHVEKLELTELLRLKDERIKILEGQDKSKNLEESNNISPYKLLPPERRAPSPPIKRY